MRTWRISAIIIAMLLLITLAGCGAFGSNAEQVSWQPVQVTRGDIQVSVSGSGKLTIPNDAKLSFGVSGRIEDISVTEDDTVTTGQVLAQLDTGALQLAITQAQTAESQALLSEEQAKAALDEANYNLDILERRHASYEEQRVAKLKISAIEQQIKTAEQQIKQAEESIAQAEKQITWATITSPMDGVVYSIDADPGDTVAAGQPVIQIIDTSNLELKVDIDEIDIPLVQLGQKVVIDIDALPVLALEGTVSSIALLSTEEGGVVSYEVTISIVVAEGSGLRAGMSATGNIVTEEKTGVLLLPNRAISRDSQGQSVVKIPSGEQTSDKTVLTGVTDGSQTEIISGVREGDTVLIEVKSRAASSGGFFSAQ